MDHIHVQRRNDGSAHFITIVTDKRNSYFSIPGLCDIVIEELEFYRDHYGFKIFGYVIMPDHIHLLIWWNNEENRGLTISKIMQGIKSVSAKRVIEYLNTDESFIGFSAEHVLRAKSFHINPDKIKGREHTRSSCKIWQRGFYDMNIYNEHILRQKLEYIHKNPFESGNIDSPENYIYSSRLFYENGNGVLKMDEY